MSKIGKVFFELQEIEDAYTRNRGPSLPAPMTQTQSKESPPLHLACLPYWPAAARKVAAAANYPATSLPF